MDAHHHPVRQTMVTGTNLEKQLPIFPCSDPKNTSMGLYIYRWYSTFIYYLLCMTLNFKYSRPNPMDDQASHLPKSTAWNSSPAMMHCIALHPCLLHSTTTSTHEIHHQFGQHQANSVEQTHIVCGKASSWPPHCLPSSLSSRGTCATGEASKTQHHTSIISKTCGWIWSWFIFTWISPWQVAGIPGRFPYYFPACLLEAPSPDII